MGLSRQEYWSVVPLPSPIGRPGVLQFIGLQRVRHDWVTELNWSHLGCKETRVLFSVTVGQSAIHWKRPWCWERFRAGGEGGDRGWNGWMLSLTQWAMSWTTMKAAVSHPLKAIPTKTRRINDQHMYINRWGLVATENPLQRDSHACDPMECSLPGSSVHGIFQVRILEWVAISWSRDQTCISAVSPALAGGFFYTTEPPGKPAKRCRCQQLGDQLVGTEMVAMAKEIQVGHSKRLLQAS